MQQDRNNYKGRAAALLGWAITFLAWTIALSLVYTVYLKFKLLFH